MKGIAGDEEVPTTSSLKELGQSARCRHHRGRAWATSSNEPASIAVPSLPSPPAAAASSCATVHGSSPLAASSSSSVPHWSCAGGTTVKYASAADARSIFADFEVLPLAKMAKRLQLLLSPTTRCLASYTFRVLHNQGDLKLTMDGCFVAGSLQGS